jgi:bromodomain-containing factor 1
MNRCYSYIQQLKKSPNAEPFLEPVNPIKLGIPDYFDVVKEPMDLSTVEKNLRTNQYSTVNQFHADINKIWMNSYRYNQKGSDIYRLTTEMEKLYKRITMKSA